MMRQFILSKFIKKVSLVSLAVAILAGCNPNQSNNKENSSSRQPPPSQSDKTDLHQPGTLASPGPNEGRNTSGSGEPTQSDMNSRQ